MIMGWSGKVKRVSVRVGGEAVCSIEGGLGEGEM
jgi:hypothetical protein